MVLSYATNFKYILFWIFILSVWSDQSEFMVLFTVLNLWIGPSFIFESCS
jgi:hypothetical protein